MMKNNDILMNQNELVQFLQKPSRDFTRDDIIRFIEAKGIAMLNFRYVSDDGKLKSLNFVPFSRDHLESILIRVPLGWNGTTNMIKDANPTDTSEFEDMPSKQTMELRSPDGSADIYKLFAGLVVATEHGLEMNCSLKKAEELYVDYNIFQNKNKAKRKNLESLPASCWESAECLLAQRNYYEKDGVFPVGVIDNVVTKLKVFDDKGLSEKLYNRNKEISDLVRKFLHCG